MLMVDFALCYRYPSATYTKTTHFVHGMPNDQNIVLCFVVCVSPYLNISFSATGFYHFHFVEKVFFECVCNRQISFTQNHIDCAHTQF